LSKGLAVYQIHKPIFEKILVKNGLPKEISALSFALTSMNPKARSYTGGAGFWQLNYSIARRYNLLIDSYVDERLDPIKSTEAFAKYCNDLYKIYNDWGLVIAAYTSGPSNLNKAIRRAEPSTDIYSIKKYLPFFSRDAVDAFVAARKFIQNNSIDYHYLIPQDNDTIEVFKRLHFEQIHAVLSIDKELIRTLNPIFPHDIVPAVRKSYSLKLPKGSLAKFNLFEDSIYKFKDSLLFRLQPRVVLPPPQADRYWTNRDDNSPPTDTKLIYYTIKSGDNLGMIAQKHNVKVSDLEDWNNIYDPRRIQIGKKLKIYVPKSSTSNVSNTESASRNRNEESENQELTDGYFWHTVQSGESPYMIAKKYPGVSADDILRWNNISDARKIQAGQKLKIKKL
jgi:membrane-bound lytic murein transglycosylase D